jgi:putative FmdB family regulatory protein
VPTYEYQCEKCGPFELWQSIKDQALSACPQCGAKVQRLISANVGFVLKGSGFYQNDYKNPSTGSGQAPSTGQAPASPAAPPKGQGPADGQGESKGCGACGGPDPCSPGNN